MQLIDTHTHIYYHQGAALEEQLERCFENGIDRLFLPNVDLASLAQIQRVVEAYPKHCYPMAGLHPCSVKEDFKEVLQTIEELTDPSKIIAIGEIGLDLHWDSSTLPLQQEAFLWQVNWAKRLGLPVVIHCRNAFDELFELLEPLKDERLFGVFHCFTGTLEEANRAISLGFKLGIGGVVTFKNSGLDKVVKQIALEHLVLETDAPYLAPVPFRGKPNESSYLLYVAQKVADLHEISLEKLAEQTTINAQNVFRTL